MNAPQVLNDGQSAAPSLQPVYEYLSRDKGFKDIVPTYQDFVEAKDTEGMLEHISRVYDKDKTFATMLDKGVDAKGAQTIANARGLADEMTLREPSKRPQNEMQQKIFNVSQQQQDPNEAKLSAGYSPIKIKAFGKQFEAPRMLTNLFTSAALNLTRGVIGGISTLVGAAGQVAKSTREFDNMTERRRRGQEPLPETEFERKAQEVFEGGTSLAAYGSEKAQKAFANSGVPLESGGVVTDPNAGAGTIAKSAAGYVAGQLTNSLPYIAPYIAGPAAGFATNVVQMSGDNTQNAYDKLKNKITKDNGGIPATDDQIFESKRLSPIVSVIAAVPEAAIERYFGEGSLVKNLTEAVAAKKLKQLIAEKGQAGLKEFAKKYLNKNATKQFAVNLAKDIAGEEVQSGIEATQGSYQAGTPQTDAGGGLDPKVYKETLVAAGAIGVGLAGAPAIINSVKAKSTAPIAEQTAASMAGAYATPNTPKPSPQKGDDVIKAISDILIDAEPSKSRSAAMRAVLEDAMQHDDVPVTTQDLAGLSTTTEKATDIVSKLRPDEEGNLTLVQDGEQLRPLTKEESDEASTFATANLLIGVHAGSLTKAHARVLTDILDGAAISQAKQDAVNDDGSPKNPLALAADNAITALKGIADKNALDTESGKVEAGDVPQELQWQSEALDQIGSMQAGDAFRYKNADITFNGIDADGNVSITDGNGANLSFTPEQVAGLITEQRAIDADVAAQKEAVSAYGDIPASSPAYEPLRAMKDFTKSMRVAFPDLQVIADKGEMDAVINKRGIALKDGDTVYGFVHNGKVYLDPDKATKDTPAHEILGHVHNNLMKQQMPDLYTKLTGLVGQTPLYQEVANDEFYKARIADGSMTADDIAEEALAQFIANHYGNQQSPYVATRWYEKLAEIVSKAWAKLFGKSKQLANLSPADIQSLTLESFADLLNQEVRRGQSSIASKEGAATVAEDATVEAALPEVTEQVTEPTALKPKQDVAFSATTENTTEESEEPEKPSGPFQDSEAMSKAQEKKKEAEEALAEAQKRGQKSLIDTKKAELAKAQLAYDTEFGKYVEAKAPELYINLTRLFEEATNRKRNKAQLERSEASKFFVKALFSKRPEISDMKKFGLLNKQLADLDSLSENAVQARTNYIRDLVKGLTPPQTYHMVRYIILSDVVGAYDEKYSSADGLREKLLPLALSEAQAREQFTTYKAWLDDSPVVKERVEWRRAYLKNLYNEAVKYGLATSFITDIKDENQQYYEWFHRSIMKYEDGEGKGKGGKGYSESLNATLKHNAFRERGGSDADYDIRLGTIDGNVVAALTYAVERRKIAIEMMAPYVQMTMKVKEGLEKFKNTSTAFLNLTLLIKHATAKSNAIKKVSSKSGAAMSDIAAKKTALVRDNPARIAILKEMGDMRKKSKAYQAALTQYKEALAQAPIVEKRKVVSAAKKVLTELEAAGKKYETKRPKAGQVITSRAKGPRKTYTNEYFAAKIAYEEAENEYATTLGNYGPANIASTAKAKALSEIEGYQALMNKNEAVIAAIKAGDEYVALNERTNAIRNNATKAAQKLENAKEAYGRELQRLTDDYMRANAPEGYTLVDAGKNPVYSLEKTDPYEIDSPFAQMGLDQIAVPVIREFTIKDGDAVYLPNEVKALFDRMNKIASEKPSKQTEQFYKGVKFIRRASAWNLLFNPLNFYNFLSQNVIENSSRAMATNLWGNNVFAMARDVGKEAIAFGKFIRTQEDPTGRYAKARTSGAINTDFGAKVIGNTPSNNEVEMLDSSRDPYLVFTFGGKVFNLPHVEPLSIKIPFKKSPVQISQGSRTDKYLGKNTVLLGVAKYLWQKAGAPLYGATVAINSSVENGYRMATIAKLEAKEGDINKPLTSYYSSNSRQINSIWDETVKMVKASDEFYKTPEAGKKPPYPVDAKTGKYLTDGGRALLRRAREQQIGTIAADIYGNYLETPHLIDQGEKSGLLMFSRYQAVNVKTTINAFRNNFIMPRQLMPDGSTNTAFPVTAGKLGAKFGWRTTGRLLHVFMMYQAAQLLTAAIRYWQTEDDDEMKKAYETLDKTNKNPFVITSLDRATGKAESYQVPNAVGDLMRLMFISDWIYTQYQNYLYFRGDKGETRTDMLEESLKNMADSWYGIVSPTVKQVASLLINAQLQDNQDRSMSLFHSKYMPSAKQGVEGVGRAGASVLAATQEYDTFARYFKKAFNANYVPTPYEEDKARESPLVAYTTLNSADLDKQQMRLAYAVASASIGKYGKAGERTEYEDLKEEEKEISKACAYALINEDVALFSRTYLLLVEAAGTEKKADRAIQYGLSLYDPFSIYDSKDKELKHKRYAMMFGAAMGFTLGLRDEIEPYSLDEAYADEVRIIEHNAKDAVDEAAQKKILDAKYSVAYDLKEKDRRVLAQGYLGFLNQKRQNYYSLLKNPEGKKFADKLADSDDLYNRVSEHYKKLHPNE